MTMDEHEDCDRQLNEAEDKIKELEADICPSWMGKEKGCNEARDVKGLEAALDVAETFLRVHKGTKLVLKQIQALNS